MEDLLIGLRAVAEVTRVRILFVLSHGEFNVSELTQILGQSQPRVSRHLKLMVEAGLVDRHKEGNWVLFRLREDKLGGALSHAIVNMLSADDHALARDLARLEEVKRQRADVAANYFSSNAANWEKLRSLHVREEDVESAMQSVVGTGKFGTLVDLGTGTGRILSLFAHQASQAIGIDSSREMVAIARANLERNQLRHGQIRQSDIYALPFGNATADLVTIHQVLHFLEEPGRALIEAKRILSPDGRILIVDFAPHGLEALRTDHAHRRLGFSTDQISQWLSRAGLELLRHDMLPPPPDHVGNGLTVSLWLAAHKASQQHTQNTSARKLEAKAS
jgi:ubiquinone/menaquinone biosynthesis C-methylase UbiE